MNIIEAKKLIDDYESLLGEIASYEKRNKEYNDEIESLKRAIEFHTRNMNDSKKELNEVIEKLKLNGIEVE